MTEKCIQDQKTVTTINLYELGGVTETRISSSIVVAVIHDTTTHPRNHKETAQGDPEGGSLHTQEWGQIMWNPGYPTLPFS